MLRKWTAEEVFEVIKHAQALAKLQRCATFDIKYLTTILNLSKKINRSCHAINNCWYHVRLYKRYSGICAPSANMGMVCKEAITRFLKEEKAMKEKSNATYKVKDKDFTGCDPIIAEHLKKGKHILCRAWDSRKEMADTTFITNYNNLDTFCYKTLRSEYKHAEPIPFIHRLKKASEIIKECENRGYEKAEGIIDKVCVGFIGWRSKNSADKPVYINMLIDCEKTTSSFDWPDWAWGALEQAI